MVHSQRVPKAMQQRFNSLCEATDAFSTTHLNEEYKQLIRALLAALCRKRPSPLLRGKLGTWAAAAVHAIGTANFLFDPSQTPHCKAAEIFGFFAVSASNGQVKSRQLMNLMEIYPFAPEWSLRSKLGSNPLVWMVEVDGFLMDARNMARHDQAQLYENGLIPFIPEPKQPALAAESTPPKPKSKPNPKSTPADPNHATAPKKQRQVQVQHDPNPDQLRLF